MIKCHDHTAQVQKGPASVTEIKKEILSFSLIKLNLAHQKALKILYNYNFIIKTSISAFVIDKAPREQKEKHLNL